MDKRDELIAEQQLKIREIESLSVEYKNLLNKINGLMYCCGGPLNDNFNQYNKSQLKIFFEIAELSYID